MHETAHKLRMEDRDAMEAQMHETAHQLRMKDRDTRLQQSTAQNEAMLRRLGAMEAQMHETAINCKPV